MFHMHFHNKGPIYRNQSKPNLATTLSILNSEEKLSSNKVFSRVHATLHPALSVRPLVCRSHFSFFYESYSLTSLLQPKWSSDLKYGPCPPASNFGIRVSGLVPDHL